MNTCVSASQVSTLLDGIVSADQLARLDPDADITGITLDSRTVSSGCLFLAMPGLKCDGRDFVSDAIDAGASVIVFEANDAPERCVSLIESRRGVGVNNLARSASRIAARFYGEPSSSLFVVGVTGTNGKTTCAYLLAQALEKLGKRAGILGTVGTGLVGQLSASALTTADAVAVQRSLAELRDDQADVVCMEVSSHGLDQYRVEAVAFDLALFTNLSQDHLDYHGDMVAYGDAKKRLFNMPGLRAMVVNADDEMGASLIAEAAADDGHTRMISYGQNGVLHADGIQHRDTGLRFTVHFGDESAAVCSPLIGEINIPNLLGVIGCLLAMDVELGRIASVMPGLLPPPGRMEWFHGRADKPVVVVDYAHTPDSLERTLRSLRAHASGKLLVVFGCGGDRDRDKRPLMGEVAARLADQVIVTNDNPRSEAPEAIAAAIVSGIAQTACDTPYEEILDRRLAIAAAIDRAAAGDLVLIAGKGHERTQTIGDQVHPFSDREIASTLLQVAA